MSVAVSVMIVDDFRQLLQKRIIKVTRNEILPSASSATAIQTGPA
jgi:hypothetical protein